MVVLFHRDLTTVCKVRNVDIHIPVTCISVLQRLNIAGAMCLSLYVCCCDPPKLSCQCVDWDRRNLNKTGSVQEYLAAAQPQNASMKSGFVKKCRNLVQTYLSYPKVPLTNDTCYLFAVLVCTHTHTHISIYLVMYFHWYSVWVCVFNPRSPSAERNVVPIINYLTSRLFIVG